MFCHIFLLEIRRLRAELQKICKILKTGKTKDRGIGRMRKGLEGTRVWHRTRMSTAWRYFVLMVLGNHKKEAKENDNEGW